MDVWNHADVLEAETDFPESEIQRLRIVGNAEYIIVSVYYSVFFASCRSYHVFWHFIRKWKQNIQLLFNLPFGRRFIGSHSFHYAERKAGKSTIYYSTTFRIQMADVYCAVPKLKKGSERGNADLGIFETYRKCKRNCNFLIFN